MDCQSWVLRGGWQGATSYPAANEHAGDLGGDGDPNWAFQALATPMNCTPESCHEGLVFVCFRFVIGGEGG